MLNRATNGSSDGWSGAWNDPCSGGNITPLPTTVREPVAVPLVALISSSLRCYCWGKIIVFVCTSIHTLVPSIPLIASHCTLTTLGSYTSFLRCFANDPSLLEVYLPTLGSHALSTACFAVVVGVHIGKRVTTPLLLGRRRHLSLY